jgi:hypothetical protein
MATTTKVRHTCIYAMNGNGMIYLISFTLRQLQLGPHACLLVGVCYMQDVVLEFLGYWGSGVPRFWVSDLW